MGYFDVKLFTALARLAEQRLPDFNPQELVNTAWAFAVANFYLDRLIGPQFTHRCNMVVWSNVDAQRGLCQLHQWALWHWELRQPLPFLPALRNRCLAAFLAARSTTSQTERKVAAALMELGGQPKGDVIITEGFSIDLIALWKGKQVALEFDGPSHFLTGLHSATGATLLKHRQLHALGWQLAVVPYW